MSFPVYRWGNWLKVVFTSSRQKTHGYFPLGTSRNISYKTQSQKLSFWKETEKFPKVDVGEAACRMIWGDRDLQEKDQNTVRVRDGQTLFLEMRPPHFPEGKLGPMKGGDWVKRHSWDWYPVSWHQKPNTMFIVLGIFYFCVPLLPSPHFLPNFLIAKIGCGSVSVSVSALSQLLTLDQGGDMAALFSVPPSSISK